jgi:hypothetical protein
MTGAQLIEQTQISHVWALLGGGPIRRGRAQAFYRKGADGFNVSINDKIGAWHDFVTGDGGGKLALICHILGRSRAEALGWMASMLGVTLDSTPLSRASEIWWIERRAELQRAKTEALKRIETPTNSGEDRYLACCALQAAASEHHLLTLMTGEGVVRAHLMARRDDPDHAAALLAEGECWREIAEALVTLLIGRWHDDAVDIERWETDGGATA